MNGRMDEHLRHILLCRLRRVDLKMKIITQLLSDLNNINTVISTAKLHTVNIQIHRKMAKLQKQTNTHM